MRLTLIAGVALAGLTLSAPVFAEEGGAAAGAATGAVTGAIVGGPVGAVVGGVAGAAIGDSATGPDRRRDTVVIDNRSRVEPCETTTVQRQNSYGDTRTTTRTNC